MARGKQKEKILTQEEKLQQALVPESEQPYEVPENWKWIHLEALKMEPDGFFDGDWILSENMDSEGEVRLLQLSDIGIGEFLDKSDKHVSEKTFLRLGCTPLLEGDVMISRMAEPIARSCIVPSFPYTVITAVDVAVLRCNPSIVFNYYLNYLCNTKWFTDLAFSMARGTTRVRITRKNLGQMPFPLPPLPEQQRIVDRIESLFAKLDEAKEKAQAVVDGFEDRKAAILYKAFTGELTERWRKEHNLELDSWLDTYVGDCSNLITKGASPRWQGVTYTDDKSQTLFVTSENVREGFMDWSREKYLDNTINEIQKRSILQTGDVLVNIVGASIGRSAIFNRECLANTNQAVCLVRVKPKLLNEYLCYYFNSPLALRYYDDNKVETARANISLANIRDMPIYLPSLWEQQEIVKRLNTMIEQEIEILATTEKAIEQINVIKKSILARAFRGELGTNDPFDESAEELLKRIL